MYNVHIVKTNNEADKMIIFPQIAKRLVLVLAEELYAKCTKEDGVLCGEKWVFTQEAGESLRTLLGLPCVPGDYSVSSLADLIMNLDYDFEGEV